MDVKSLKLDLINWLTELKDPNILKQLKAIKESHDWWDEIGEEEKKAIDEGLNQLDRGETVPHEEVMKKVRKRFNL